MSINFVQMIFDLFICIPKVLRKYFLKMCLRLMAETYTVQLKKKNDFGYNQNFNPTPPLVV